MKKDVGDIKIRETYSMEEQPRISLADRIAELKKEQKVAKRRCKELDEEIERLSR